MEQNPPSPPDGRDSNPLRTPSPTQEVNPSPLITPPGGSGGLVPIREAPPSPPPPNRGETARSRPITPPSPDVPLGLPRSPSPPPPVGGEITIGRPITPPSPDIPRRPGETITNRPITPPSPDQPPQVRQTGDGPSTQTINEPVRIYDRKLTKEDYDSVLQKLDDLDRRSQGPKPQIKDRFSYLPASQIRHVKGGPGVDVLAPDEDFVVQILQFPPHEDGPRSDEFFDHLFQEAYAIVLGFVVNNFGGFDIKPEEHEWKHPWNEMNAYPLFISLAELVEDVEPDHPKGWDTLLYKQTKRNMMIVGIIARIFIDKVFSPLLFGCTPTQATMLNALETDMAENSSDGFVRTKTRSRAVREVLDGETLPIHFFDEVEQLSLNIFGLLNPVSAYLEKYLMKHPEIEVTIPTRAEQFAKLFDMVSGTAWLAVCRRVHPEPIIIRMSEPGDMFKEDSDVVANYDEYFENKGRILKLQYDRLGEALEREKKLSEDESTDVEELPPTEILKERIAFVKTAVWPSIKIYSPVQAGGEYAQSGVTEYTIQKCEVAAQWVVPSYNREAVIPSLREWAKLT